MIDTELIRRIEEASFNAWPALNVLLYDGWLLRFANGYTKRANSVNGLFQGRLQTEAKIDYCEAVYTRQQLQPVFRLTPLINPDDLDERLDTRNYRLIDHTSVQSLDLMEIGLVRSERSVILSGHDGINAWLRSFHDLNPQRKDVATHELMMQNIAGTSCLMVLVVNSKIVACGLGVADGDYLGLFDIIVAVEHRRKGYGMEITASLLAWGLAMKSHTAYLQVMTNNGPANKLYQGLGFQEIYRYWYRVAPDNYNGIL